MRKLSVFGLFALLFSAGNAHAANFAVITSPPTLLSLIVFLGAVACLWGGLKVISLVKGGFLQRSWQIFLGSFIVLSLSQLLNLLHDFEIIAVPQYVVPALLTVTTGLFFYAIFETKKTLE